MNKPDAKGMFQETTLTATSRNRQKQYADKVYIISRYDKSGKKTPDLHTLTWNEIAELTESLAKGLDALGIKPLDRVAVIGPNTPRWMQAVFAIGALRGTVVPVYPTSKQDDVWWIIHDSAVKAVFCHGKEHVEKALEAGKKEQGLKHVIVMDPSLKVDDPRVISFDALLDLGRKNSKAANLVDTRIQETTPDDLAAIIYTSGTTGRPKGVMLTNNNFVAQRGGVADFDFNPDDIWFCHLPLCHSFGFSSDLLNSGFQGGTLYMCDSVETEELRKNLLACRPTVMSSVPRMWEKVFVQVDRTVKQRPPIAQKIFAWAIATGRQKYLLENEHKPLPLGLKLKLKLADKIFMKVKTQAGIDRLRICHTGGGPIDPELITFFGSIGIKLYQGFGLTETAPVTHTCTPLHHKLGWVGRPIPNTFVKIAEDGEILIKGPQVMKGYLNNPEANVEAFTADGYFRTGDIGEVDPEGYMKITDRKKDLIITSGGKNIAPQIIENSFNTDPYIEQVYVTGEKRKYIAGLVVPNYQNLEQWAKEKGISFSSKTDLIANEKVKAFIKERIDKVNSTLSKYETIKHFAVLENEFTEAGGELTPTLKRKRKVIEAKYKDVIETLYPQDKN